MFVIRLAVLIFVLATLAQVPGCHYFIDAAPRIIISSEPIHAPAPVP
ncbi:hypothetical protein ES703_19885 [subsurface metagenome]